MSMEGATTYGDVGDTQDKALGGTSLTKVTTISMLPGGPWTIKKIRLSIVSKTAGEIVGGYVELKIDRVKGPFQYPFGSSFLNAGTAAGERSQTPAEEIDVNIPGVPGSANIEIHVKNFTDADVAAAGIVYV